MSVGLDLMGVVTSGRAQRPVLGSSHGRKPRTSSRAPAARGRGQWQPCKLIILLAFVGRRREDPVFKATTKLMVGSTIGPYRVLRKIGEGGMGAVFEALHETIERHVAIKVLHPALAKNPEAASRFVNE